MSRSLIRSRGLRGPRSERPGRLAGRRLLTACGAGEKAARRRPTATSATAASADGVQQAKDAMAG